MKQVPDSLLGVPGRFPPDRNARHGFVCPACGHGCAFECAGCGNHAAGQRRSARGDLRAHWPVAVPFGPGGSTGQPSIGPKTSSHRRARTQPRRQDAHRRRHRTRGRKHPRPPAAGRNLLLRRRRPRTLRRNRPIPTPSRKPKAGPALAVPAECHNVAVPFSERMWMAEFKRAYLDDRRPLSRIEEPWQVGGIWGRTGRLPEHEWARGRGLSCAGRRPGRAAMSEGRQAVSRCRGTARRRPVSASARRGRPAPARGPAPSSPPAPARHGSSSWRARGCSGSRS